MRLAGRGDAGSGGGPAGDLFLVLGVEPHPVFRREGRNLLCDVPVGLARAALGGTVEVPTLNGPATITVPGRHAQRAEAPLKGKGVPPGPGEPAAGDLFAVIQIQPPNSLDERSRELMEEFQRLNPESGVLMLHLFHPAAVHFTVALLVRGRTLRGVPACAAPGGGRNSGAFSSSRACWPGCRRWSPDIWPPTPFRSPRRRVASSTFTN